VRLLLIIVCFVSWSGVAFLVSVDMSGAWLMRIISLATGRRPPPAGNLTVRLLLTTCIVSWSDVPFVFSVDISAWLVHIISLTHVRSLAIRLLERSTLCGWITIHDFVFHCESLQDDLLPYL
jgi:hypothetical protein